MRDFQLSGTEVQFQIYHELRSLGIDVRPEYELQAVSPLSSKGTFKADLAVFEGAALKVVCECKGYDGALLGVRQTDNYGGCGYPYVVAGPGTISAAVVTLASYVSTRSSRLSKSECAQILSALCSKKLGTRITITEREVSAALASRAGLHLLSQVDLVASDAPSPEKHSADIDVIINHWRSTYEPKDPEVGPTARARIELALNYPISVADCIRVLDMVLVDPEAIGRRRKRPDVGTVFRSVGKLCRALGREYVPPRGWLDPFDQVWQRHYKTSLPFGQAAKSLAPLVAQHGPEEVAKRLDVYCRQTTAMYVSFSRFASTFGSWVPGTIQKTGARDKTLAGSMVEGL